MKQLDVIKTFLGIRCLILIGMLSFFSSISLAENNVGIVNASALNLRKHPSGNSETVGKLMRGDTVEFVAIDKGWAEIVWQGDTCYASAQYITPGEESGDFGLPAWVNPDEGKGRWGSMGHWFSTDRIMEALPDFGLLRGKLPFDPDACFHIAFWLLLLSAIVFPFLEDRIEFGNVWYWGCYAVALAISVCELLYFLSSPDPLGFCDTNNVWFVTALFYLLLCGLALYHQLRLFSTILFVTQRDADFDFKAGMAVKLMMLAVIYFIVSVVVFHFGEQFPEQVNYCALGMLLLPVLLMLYRAAAERDVVPLLALLPFYCIAGAATLAVYCVIGVVMAVMLFVWLVISLLGGNDDVMFVKKGGVWYYCDFDTWLEGYRERVWDDWSSTFHGWMRPW